MDLAKIWGVLERYGAETIVLVALICAAAYVLAHAIPAYFRYRAADRDSARRHELGLKNLRSKAADRRRSKSKDERKK